MTNKELQNDLDDINLDHSGINDPLYTFFGYPSKIYYENISELITTVSDKGDIIFDPFAGSGSTGIASVVNDRKCILNDGSYLSYYIMDSLFSDIDLSEFESEFETLKEEIQPTMKELYKIDCACCDQNGQIKYIMESNRYSCENCKETFQLYNNDTDGKGKYSCPHCGHTMSTYSYLKEPNRVEKRSKVEVNYTCENCDCGNIRHTREIQSQDRKEWRKMLDKYNSNIWEPTEEVVTDRWYTRKGGWPGIPKDAQFTELFSDRNLVALTLLRKKIDSIENDNIKQQFMLIFLASLIRSSKRMYESSVVKQYYQVPKVGKTQNVWDVFERKYNTYLKAKTDLDNKKGTELDSSVTITNSDASNLDTIPQNSVDVVFADPPYGSKISYYELNLFYTAWLDKQEDLDSEIIIPTQTDTDDNYAQKWKNMMTEPLVEAKRVLKDDGVMIISFESTSQKIWNGLLDILYKELGFELLAYVDKNKGETFHMNRKSDTNVHESYIILQNSSTSKSEDSKNIVKEDLITKVENKLSTLDQTDIQKNQIRDKVIEVSHESNNNRVPTEEEFESIVDRLI